MVSQYKKLYNRTKTKIRSYESTSGGNGGIRNVEGRYDAVRGNRTGSNKSPPFSVPVTRRLSRVKLAVILWRSICGYIPVSYTHLTLPTIYSV